MLHSVRISAVVCSIFAVLLGAFARAQAPPGDERDKHRTRLTKLEDSDYADRYETALAAKLAFIAQWEAEGRPILDDTGTLTEEPAPEGSVAGLQEGDCKEDFEGSFPGDYWIDVGDADSASGSDYWDDVSCNDDGGDWSGWCADIGNTDCTSYDNDMEAYMCVETRYLGTTGGGDNKLKYDRWGSVEDCCDQVRIRVEGFASEPGSGYRVGSPDVTANFVVQDTIECGFGNINCLLSCHNGRCWEAKQISLPERFNPYVWVRICFVFESDGSVTDEGAYFDDINFNCSSDTNIHPIRDGFTGGGAICDDGTCDPGETTCNCPQDCGISCGDGCCNGGEDSSNCCQDCGSCPTDDCLEENDTLGAATNISSREQEWLSTYSGCGTANQCDDDWYRINLSSNRRRVLVDCTFTDADGDIDISLHDSSGTELCDSTSTSNDEHIDCVAPSDGTHYIRVYFDDECNPYDLWWDDVPSPVECGNGLCETGETTCNCPQDCGTSCGDGCCNGGETSSNCCRDCAECCNNGDCNDGNPCTDDICSNGTCQNPPNFSCGDGTCDSACGETRSNCCQDCADCGDGTCDPCEEGRCPQDCDVDPCESQPYTIGGAVFEDCDDPLGSGVADVPVSVVCNGGYSCNTTTFGGQGLWSCNSVPCDTCTVTVLRACYLETALCPPVPCSDSVVATVDDDHLPDNQSLAFHHPGCVLHDVNGDGFVSILGDVPCFVDCLFFGNCPPQGACSGRYPCACDCNGDGFCSILGDVPCFVDCVFFNQCPEPAIAPDLGGNTAATGFTVGGAVYANRDDPLTTGVEGVAVELFDALGNSIGFTTTGRLGIWKVGAVPTGAYSVVFHTVQRDGSVAQVSRTIAVEEGNKVAMQSIQLQLPEERPRQESQPRKLKRDSRR